jgi:hypothetical protein
MPRHTLEAAEKPLLDIFCDKYLFRIPSYQRPYAWTTEQASDLFDDIVTACGDTGEIADQSPYFLGNIVLIKDPNTPDAEVVDGQQRLTTLTIFLAVLRDVEGGNVGEDIQRSYICQEGSVTRGIPDSYRLSPRERDTEFFRANIQTDGATASLPEEAGLSDARRCFVGNAQFFQDKLSDLPAAVRKRLIMFLVQRCYLVVVAASDRESAFRIFSVLNTRGLDLSPADILKADIIGAIPAADQDSYTETWEDLEDGLGRARFAELFGHIRMIHRKQKMRANLVAEFKEFVPAFQTPQNFIKAELEPYADAYKEILDRRFESHTLTDEINRVLAHLSRLDNIDWQPPAIHLIATHRHNPAEVLRFLTDLERLAYALFLARETPTDRIARYGKVLETMEAGADLFAVGSPLQLSEDEKRAARDVLNGGIYTTTRIVQPVLLRLDEAIGAGGATYDHPIITVEHVLPQNPEEGSRWFTDFPDEQVQHSWVHRVANLVLLTRRKNTQASNLDFDEKKTRYFTTRGGVSNFALTSTVIQEPRWDVATLERRQTELHGRLVAVWRLG